MNLDAFTVENRLHDFNQIDDEDEDEDDSKSYKFK